MFGALIASPFPIGRAWQLPNVFMEITGYQTYPALKLLVQMSMKKIMRINVAFGSGSQLFCLFCFQFFRFFL